MFLNLPENLNDQQKEVFQRSWLSMLMMVINAIKFFALLAFMLVIFAFFGDSLTGMFRKPPPVPEGAGASQPVATAEVDEFDKIENGIHVMTGLKVAEGWEIVRGVCTACHSAKMITQTTATRDGWEQMIRWMQKTQGLWDLGDQEKLILDYLATNYAPEDEGRRANLDIEAIEWYVLELEAEALQ